MNYLLGEFKYKIHPDSREYWQYHFLVSHVSFQSELKFSLLTENPVKLGRKIRDKNCLGFSSDGNYLAFCYEGAVRIFNLSGNRTKRVTFEPTLGYITSICFVPGTADFVIGGQNGRIYLCDITGSFRRVFVPRAAEAYYKGISCLEISHDGTQLAAGYGDTKVRFWNIDNDAQCQTILGSQGAVESLAFSPEGQYFAVGTGDKFVRVFDIKSTPYVLSWQLQHPNVANSISFLPDGAGLIVGSRYSSSTLYNLSKIQARLCGT
jgi:WD40 repeat protein